jgi:hypothetical protein
MKRLLLYASLISISYLGFSQDITIYGFLPSNNPDTDFLKLGKIDALSGTLMDIDSIYPVNAYALGSSAYDAFQSAYMFLGVDTAFNFRLYSRSIRGENTFSDPIINETVNDLQFDMNTTNTYGIGNFKSDSVLIDSINDIWMYDYAMRFLSVDQDSGTISELEQYPDLVAFPVGSSTFDANNGRYIVNAYDSSYVDRLVIIDAGTGSVISKEPTGTGPGEYLNNLEYNNEDDKIYGLFRANNSTFQAIVSLDISNQNLMDTIYIFSDLQYFVQGSAVLHQASQTYILYYIDTTNNSRLALIDLVNGVMIDNPVINESITELEVDNTEYALAKYHESVGVDEQLQLKTSTNVYPNPASGLLTIDLKEKAEQISLISLGGKQIFTLENHQAGKIRIPVDHLLPGIYSLLIYRGNQKESIKIVIQ